ncbi:hypothetical protein INR49_004280 [Caranx melampygus]|nr:hypothetical protein INR49_004280 [Caranx melampygus]
MVSWRDITVVNKRTHNSTPKQMRSPANNSQLKDSMDLYEEIVTEEQQGRETLYTELSASSPSSSSSIMLSSTTINITSKGESAFKGSSSTFKDRKY